MSIELRIRNLKKQLTTCDGNVDYAVEQAKELSKFKAAIGAQFISCKAAHKTLADSLKEDRLEAEAFEAAVAGNLNVNTTCTLTGLQASTANATFTHTKLYKTSVEESTGGNFFEGKSKFIKDLSEEVGKCSDDLLVVQKTQKGLSELNGKLISEGDICISALPKAILDLVVCKVDKHQDCAEHIKLEGECGAFLDLSGQTIAENDFYTA